MGWWNKLVQNKKKTPESVKKSEPKKLTAKEQATKNGEPYIDILKVDIDIENPSYGSFEMDWNEHFVKKTARHGLPWRDRRSRSRFMVPKCMQKYTN